MKTLTFSLSWLPEMGVQDTPQIQLALLQFARMVFQWERPRMRILTFIRIRMGLIIWWSSPQEDQLKMAEGSQTL
jgi:hypothetical protein